MLVISFFAERHVPSVIVAAIMVAIPIFIALFEIIFPRTDLELLVAGQRAPWRRDGHKARSRMLGNGCGQESVGQNPELCGLAVEGDARGSGEALAEDINGLAGVADGRKETSEWPQSRIETIKHTDTEAAAAAGLSV